MDKILFLDVDGVLNNETWAGEMWDDYNIKVYNKNILYQPALVQLRRIINATGAKIVVSSSWRKIHDAYQDLLRWLDMYGMNVLDTTSKTTSRYRQIRGDDIGEWLNAHPGVESYAILDDDDDMGEHMNHLIRTNMYYGLTEEKANACIDLLNGKSANRQQLNGNDGQSDSSNERIGRL